MRRSIGPWFRASKNAWYVCHEGKQVNLFVKGEENEAKAVKAWHRLMAGDEPVKPVKREPTGIPCPVSVPPQKQEPGGENQTLPALVKAFLADAEARVKPESLANYRLFLTPFADAFKTTPPVNLTIRQVERWSKKPGWSQSYRCGFVGTAVSLFRWAVDTGRLDRNPIAGIKKPKKQSRGRKAIISADDHATLVKVAKGDWKDFLQLLWLSGARPGEISGLTAEVVDLTSKTVILSEHKTAEQTGKDRLIILPDEAVNILQRLIAKRPEGLLFPGEDGQRMTPQAVTKRMERLCRKAGVKAITYGYRHTFATDALANGVPDAHVAALLGHSGTAMLHKHYSHLTEKAQALRSALGQVRKQA
jgi:integrase/recombinase XerC